MGWMCIYIYYTILYYIINYKDKKTIYVAHRRENNEKEGDTKDERKVL